MHVCKLLGAILILVEIWRRMRFSSYNALQTLGKSPKTDTICCYSHKSTAVCDFNRYFPKYSFKSITIFFVILTTDVSERYSNLSLTIKTIDFHK